MSNGEDVGCGDGRTGSVTSATVSRRQLLASVTATTVGASAFTGYALGSPLGVGESVETADEYGGVSVTRDEVWVETDVDTNDSGTPDRIQVRVARADETEEGERHPVIAVASPYYGEQDHGDTTDEMRYDRAVDPAASTGDDSESETASDADDGTPTAAVNHVGPSHDGTAARGVASPGHLERRYVPKGYAVAKVSSLGTADSTGCYTAAGPPTVEALAAVVDWFNGRATAYDAPEGGEPVAADWTNGRTGMIGTSANGELANGVATTGVDGLEAVVPQAANVGQYGLFRSNGTPVSVLPNESDRMADLASWVQASNAKRPDCDRWAETVEDAQAFETGDYNDFWHERTFLTDADAVEAGVLLTHAVDDPIVKPNNVADWYETLAAHDVPVRLWLHEGGHTAPRGEAWIDTLDRWWAYWLKDAENGVMDEDPVTVVRGGPSAAHGPLETYEEWPVPESEPTTVGFTSGGSTAGAVVTGASGSGTESLVDDPSTSASDLVGAAESDHRLRYETPALAEPVHVSGRVVPSLALSVDEPTVVSAALVEYGEAGAEVVTRGWADPLNRPRYGDYDTPLAYRESLRESSPLDGGEQVRVEFPLQATDHVFEEGSRIGLVVYASDRAFTLHPPGSATVTLSLSESSVDLPVVGGANALTGAFADESTPTATTEPTTTESPAGASTATEPATEQPSETPAPTESEAPDTADETTSDGGPGFGVGSALAALAGGTGLLKRRFDDE